MQNLAQPRWYRRTGARVALAAGVAAGVGVVAVGLGSGASATVDPERAVEQAADALRDMPSSVTITGADEGEVTLTRTGDYAAVSMVSPDGTVDAALRSDTLYLRVDAPALESGSGLALGLLGNLPSIGALLDGQWVSLDVSQDSDAMDALRSLKGADVADPAALQAAAEQLEASLTAIGEQLREPMAQALQDNSEVVEVGDGSGPAGSTQYRVTLDRDGASSQLQPALRAAFDEALVAMDAFVAEAGAQLPDNGAMWQERRAELVAGFEEALAEGDTSAATVDVWIADGRFTQISAGSTTLAFSSDDLLDVPSDAVSMDQDLVTVLPLLQGLQGLQLPKPGA